MFSHGCDRHSSAFLPDFPTRNLKLETRNSSALRSQIQSSGPITFRDWMAAALYDPEFGYYCQSGIERWGRSGDYRTSPERSLLFSATFARYFVSLHAELSKTGMLRILEAGAGAGYFAAGVLDTLVTEFPNLYENCCYLIDERSRDAQALAADRLQRFGTHLQFEHLGELDTPVDIVFANELLDAFPVHRVTVRDGRLLEFYVGVAANGEFKWEVYSASTPELEEYFLQHGSLPAEGQIAEVNLEIADWLRTASEKIERGFLVLADYGAEGDELFQAEHYREGTLRAFRQHQFMPNVLNDPGGQDLTTTIDWKHVRRLCSSHGFELVKFERQDKFLLGAGILEELERQTAQVSEVEATRLRTEAREMVLPSGMAASFQVLVLRRSN